MFEVRPLTCTSIIKCIYFIKEMYLFSKNNIVDKNMENWQVSDKEIGHSD